MGPPDQGPSRVVSPHYLLPVFEYSSYLKLKDLKKESCGQESVDGSDKQETFKLVGKLIKSSTGCKKSFKLTHLDIFCVLSSDTFCMT